VFYPSLFVNAAATRRMELGCAVPFLPAGDVPIPPGDGTVPVRARGVKKGACFHVRHQPSSVACISIPRLLGRVGY